MRAASSHDDAQVIAGQGTIGLEIAAQAAAQNITTAAVIACCGGGGLGSGIAGIAGAATAFFVLRDTDVDMSLSVKADATVIGRLDPPLAEGQRVLIHAKPDFYAGRGSLSMWAKEIRPIDGVETVAQFRQAEGNLRAYRLLVKVLASTGRAAPPAVRDALGRLVPPSVALAGLGGSAAGGGVPQWNCRCRNCAAVRAGSSDVRPRTQSSVAVSADGTSVHDTGPKEWQAKIGKIPVVVS